MVRKNLIKVILPENREPESYDSYIRSMLMAQVAQVAGAIIVDESPVSFELNLTVNDNGNVPIEFTSENNYPILLEQGEHMVKGTLTVHT